MNVKTYIEISKAKHKEKTYDAKNVLVMENKKTKNIEIFVPSEVETNLHGKEYVNLFNEKEHIVIYSLIFKETKEVAGKAFKGNLTKFIALENNSITENELLNAANHIKLNIKHNKLK